MLVCYSDWLYQVTVVVLTFNLSQVLKLDDAVHNIVDGPPFEGQVDIERVGEGVYNLDGKLIFIRVKRLFFLYC